MAGINRFWFLWTNFNSYDIPSRTQNAFFVRPGDAARREDKSRLMGIKFNGMSSAWLKGLEYWTHTVVNVNLLYVSTFSFSNLFDRNLMRWFVREGRGRAVWAGAGEWGKEEFLFRLPGFPEELWFRVILLVGVLNLNLNLLLVITDNVYWSLRMTWDNCLTVNYGMK